MKLSRKQNKIPNMNNIIKLLVVRVDLVIIALSYEAVFLCSEANNGVPRLHNMRGKNKKIRKV